jgi:putative ABC transport system permease protein
MGGLMLDYAMKNLKARKTRTTLCILAIVVCVFLISTVDGMLSQMRSGFVGELSRYMGKVSLQQSGSGYPPFNSAMDEDVATKVLGRDDIIQNESTPLLLTVILPADNPMDVAGIYGVGIMPGREKAYLLDTKTREGVLFFQDGKSVVLGETAAERLDASVGKEIEVGGEKATVSGVLEFTGQDSIDKALLMPLKFAQTAFGKEHIISTVLLTAKDARKVEEVAEDLERQYPKLEAVTQSQVEETIDKIMDMPNKFMGMISATVFLVSIIIIMNVMVMAIVERRREIGILRALGASQKLILKTILEETIVLSIAGGVVGLALTIPIAYLQDWTWILSYGEMVKVGFLVLVIGVMSGVYPAYRAVKVDPMEAIRYE